MRELTDAGRLAHFMRELGRSADEDGACYLAGGATAVLYGWRETTIDVDIKLVPELDAVLRALPRLKDALRINVELASPSDFIPVVAGWEERGIFVTREGRLSFYHFDLVAQALAKAERAHTQDLEDIEALLERELVDRAEVLEAFEAIEPDLYRFPAVDAAAFGSRVESLFGGGA